MLLEEVEEEGNAIEFVSLWFVLFRLVSPVCLRIVLEKYIPYYDFD